MVHDASHLSPGAAAQILARRRASTILVADDDPHIRRGLKLRLEATGYRVTVAADGHQAMSIFAEHAADLVILDVKMPGIDGFEVCKAIKKLKKIPIIFVTGVQSPIMRQYLPNMVEAVGGDHFIRKPFDTQALLEVVNECLCSTLPNELN